MDSEVVIGVEGLGKRYSLGSGSGERYTALRDVIARSARSLLRRTPPSAEATTEEDSFWALRDISFEVKRGEVIGIIGRNGAGKSTLLKILSRITEPTEGRLTLRGRVASLLEVGTGFHPELTGRENIFLNGAILGMHRHEMKAKFDEIVAFAEVERFLDTPVKRYSSGMYVRLAFAVAAHLEPEILIVDEVLAVGDAEFQKRCLGKMGEVARGSGRTVLFVSHNMGAIQSLCGTCVYLKSGRVVTIGKTPEVTALFQTAEKVSGLSTREVAFTSTFKLLGCQVKPGAIRSREPVNIDLIFRSLERNVASELCVLIYNEYGQRIAIVDLRSAKTLVFEPGRTTTISVSVDSIPFIEGRYDVGLWIDSVAVRCESLELASFEVLPTTSEVAPYERSVRGFVELETNFEVNNSF